MATSKWTKDRLVESLAWFSFHVPAIVLEDISELNVQEEEEEIRRSEQEFLEALNEEGEEDEFGDFDIDTSLHIQEMRLVEMEEEGEEDDDDDEMEEEDVENNSESEDAGPAKRLTTFQEGETNNPESDNSGPVTRWTTSCNSSSVRNFSVQNSSVRHFGGGRHSSDPWKPPPQKRVTVGQVTNIQLDLSQKDDFMMSVFGKPSSAGRSSSRSTASSYTNGSKFKVPPFKERECALLFIDISGFTKLSTKMGVEDFSDTINTYFDNIVTEIKGNGGDILKFAGDALFAEWRVQPAATETSEHSSMHKMLAQGLQKLTRSLQPDEGITLEKCVTDAALCGSSIVEALSDYEVEGCDHKLNVHCGLGAGKLIGLHTENNNGDRREYIFLGDIIDQVSEAEGKASHGELAASPQAIKLLSKHSRMPPTLLKSTSPSIIATRGRRLFRPTVTYTPFDIKITSEGLSEEQETLMKEYENIDSHTIEKLQRQLSLYAHTVVCEDEFAKRPSSQTHSLELVEQRHRSEAELRDVYVMFINPRIDATVTGDYEIDKHLYQKLDAVMKEVCDVIEDNRGHLRQFIRDDKGVVLIATFGLRGSTTPNMVAACALPATQLVHDRLRDNLGIECCIGATYGPVYCGVVGGVRRHEYAAIGPNVNLAARLMASKQNKGILVSDMVKDAGDLKYHFKSYGSVAAKGYANPIPIYEPGKRVASYDELPEEKRNWKDATLPALKEAGIHKLDRLGPVVREICQTCAVLGDEFQLFDVYRVNTHQTRHEILNALDEAIKENFLQQGNDKLNLPPSKPYNKSYRFTHGNWRDMILENMTNQKIDEIKETLKHFEELKRI